MTEHVAVRGTAEAPFVNAMADMRGLAARAALDLITHLPDPDTEESLKVVKIGRIRCTYEFVYDEEEVSEMEKKAECPLCNVKLENCRHGTFGERLSRAT